MKISAYLQITMKIAPANRPAAAQVYSAYRQPFLDEVAGALSKEILIRDEDVQVVHGFDSPEHAKAYLGTELFAKKVAPELQPLFEAPPDIRVYSVA